MQCVSLLAEDPETVALLLSDPCRCAQTNMDMELLEESLEEIVEEGSTRVCVEPNPKRQCLAGDVFSPMSAGEEEQKHVGMRPCTPSSMDCDTACGMSFQLL